MPSANSWHVRRAAQRCLRRMGWVPVVPVLPEHCSARRGASTRAVPRARDPRPGRAPNAPAMAGGRSSAGKRPGRAATAPGQRPAARGWAARQRRAAAPADAGPGGCHRSPGLPGLPFASRPCRPGRVQSRSRQSRPECRSLSDPRGAGPGQAGPPAATASAGLGRARRGCGRCVHGGRDRAGQRGAEGGDNPVVAVTWSR